jgi:hypothetical protein
MSPREVELALKKQRLQMQSAALRVRFMRQTQAFAPTFAAFDQVRAGYGWLRQRPYIWVGAAVALAVVKPRVAWRWLKRGVLAWQTVRRVRGLAEQWVPAYLAGQAGQGDD